jgi:hypothetical protein
MACRPCQQRAAARAAARSATPKTAPQTQPSQPAQNGSDGTRSFRTAE